MGKLRTNINGVDFIGSRQNVNVWITVNDGEDLGPISMMIHCAGRGFGHGVVLHGGEVIVKSVSKKTNGGVVYSMDCYNPNDKPVIPQIEIAWSDT